MMLENQPKGRFPFFYAWCHPDFYRGYGWSFGFYFAPWPREEHKVGDLVRALCLVEGFFCLKPKRFWIYLWSADPADRPMFAGGEG